MNNIIYIYTKPLPLNCYLKFQNSYFCESVNVLTACQSDKSSKKFVAYLLHTQRLYNKLLKTCFKSLPPPRFPSFNIFISSYSINNSQRNILSSVRFSSLASNAASVSHAHILIDLSIMNAVMRKKHIVGGGDVSVSLRERL